MTEKREDLLKKITALLSKTIDAGCTESEAMAALQKAQGEAFAVLKTLVLAAALLAGSPAHADNHAPPNQCSLFLDLQGQVIHVRVPSCRDGRGHLVIEAYETDLHINSRKGQSCITHVDGLERVDDVTYLVLTRCPGAKPEAETLVFQLIDDGDGGELRITNAENS
jgi:hypothetical protein